MYLIILAMLGVVYFVYCLPFVFDDTRLLYVNTDQVSFTISVRMSFHCGVVIGNLKCIRKFILILNVNFQSCLESSMILFLFI